jgi:hypothetical protein
LFPLTDNQNVELLYFGRCLVVLFTIVLVLPNIAAIWLFIETPPATVDSTLLIIYSVKDVIDWWWPERWYWQKE